MTAPCPFLIWIFCRNRSTLQVARVFNLKSVNRVADVSSSAFYPSCIKTQWQASGAMENVTILSSSVTPPPQRLMAVRVGSHTSYKLPALLCLIIMSPIFCSPVISLPANTAMLSTRQRNPTHDHVQWKGLVLGETGASHQARKPAHRALLRATRYDGLEILRPSIVLTRRHLALNVLVYQSGVPT